MMTTIMAMETDPLPQQHQHPQPMETDPLHLPLHLVALLRLRQPLVILQPPRQLLLLQQPQQQLQAARQLRHQQLSQQQLIRVTND
jgi:hypothetical protein